MNIKRETFLEVVAHLVGYTYPDGDEDIDKGRYENQEKIIDLLTNGVEDLINNSKYKNDPIQSKAFIGNRAYEALNSLHECIKDAL